MRSPEQGQYTGAGVLVMYAPRFARSLEVLVLISYFIGVDTETCLIEPGLLAPPLVCLTWATPPGPEQQSGILRWDDPQVVQFFEQALASRTLLVGANIAYDTAVACAQYPELIVTIFGLYDADCIRDVQLDQKLIDIANGELMGVVEIDDLTGEEEFVSHKYSLAALSERLLGVFMPKEDTWRLRYSELRDVPLEQWPEDARRYAINDAIAHANVFAKQQEEHECVRDSADQSRAAFALHLAGCWGVPTDRQTIEELEADLLAASKELTERLLKPSWKCATCGTSGTFDQFQTRQQHTAAGHLMEVFESLIRPANDEDKNSRNTKAAKARMLSDALEREAMPKLTKAGLAAAEEVCKARGERYQPWAPKDEPGSPYNYLSAAEIEEYASLDEEACRESGDPLLKDYAERTSVQSMLEQHVPALLRGSGSVRIQPRYDPLVASGRAACKGPDLKNPNPTQYGYQIHNPRRRFGVRECFVAPPGRAIIDVDYNQGELVTVADACWRLVGYSRLGEALNAGQDVHLRLGAKIIGLTYEDAREHKKRKDVSDARQLAKAPDFGFPGGMGPYGMMRFASKGYGIKMSMHEAKMLRNDFLGEWQEFKEYFEIIREITETGDGGAHIEQLVSRRIRGKIRYTVACNTIFQGLLADIAKRALYEVTRECMTEKNSVLYGTRPWGFIHDQILADAPIEVAHEAAFRMRDIMVDVANKQYLEHVTMTAEPVVSSCWSKYSEQTWLDRADGRGPRLIPWSIRIYRYDHAEPGLRETFWERLLPDEQEALRQAGRAYAAPQG